MRSTISTCSEPGCPELVSGRYCSRHARENRQRWDRGFGWVYRDPRWAALRRQVRREQPTCARVGCSAPWTDLDHRVGLRDGGAPFDRTNVHGLCHSHHSQKTAGEVWWT